MANILLFLFLSFLPFGQILRLPISLAGIKFYLNFSDAIAVSALTFAIFSKLARPPFWKQIKDFVIVVGFSLIFSVSIFEPSGLFLGFFYFLRVASYFCLFLLLWNFFRKQKSLKTKVFRALILSSGFIALFGWLQYLFYPDLRALAYFDWDDHLLRMVGGFLDPAFTGILLVFGVVLATTLYLKKKSKKLLFFILFLLASLALTYSRTSYLALGAAFGAMAVLEKRFKELIFLGAVFTLMVLSLPHAEGEGVKLARVSSVYAKVQNYRDSLKLAKISPIFGIGFNNVCLAKELYLGEKEITSHACSGLDSSLLFLLVTTGAAGVFSFANLISALSKNLKKDIFGRTLIISATALFVHSLFTNSLFYSWVMGLMAVLAALAL